MSKSTSIPYKYDLESKNGNCIHIKILISVSEEVMTKDYINLCILPYQLFKTIQILITALSIGIFKWAVTVQIQLVLTSIMLSPI